jgi:hypothetical protein
VQCSEWPACVYTQHNRTVLYIQRICVQSWHVRMHVCACHAHQCTHSYMSTFVHSEYGLCAVFKTNTQLTDPTAGLRLFLYAPPANTVGSGNGVQGFRVVVHNPNAVTIRPDVDGMAVPTGANARIIATEVCVCVCAYSKYDQGTHHPPWRSLRHMRCNGSHVFCKSAACAHQCVRAPCRIAQAHRAHRRARNSTMLYNIRSPTGHHRRIFQPCRLCSPT